MCNAGKKGAPQAQSGSPAGARVAKLGSKGVPRDLFRPNLVSRKGGGGTLRVRGVGYLTRKGGGVGGTSRAAQEGPFSYR